MGQLIFFAKTLVMTLVIAAALQIEVGERTAEAHLMNFVANSSTLQPVKNVASSAAIGVELMWRKIKTLVESKVKGQDEAGRKRLSLQLERSTEFLKERAEKAKNKVQEVLVEDAGSSTSSQGR